MKRFFLVMILFFSCMLVALARGGVDSVLVRLDRVMGQQDIYMEQKEERIDSLKQLLHHSSLTLRQQFMLNKALGAEYELFVSDSAMKYFDNSLLIADSLRSVPLADEVRLCQTSVLSISGMYKEAWETLHGIDRATLPDSLLPAFYDCGQPTISGYKMHTVIHC